MALSVGELVGYLRLDGGAAFDRQVGSAQRSLDLTGRSATKMGASLKTSEAALTRTGRAAETASATSGKLRAAQLSVVAAQERYNAVLAKGDASTMRLASSEAALIRAQQRLAASQRAVHFAPAPADPGGLVKFRHNALGAIETVGKLGLSLGVFELGMKGLEEFKEGNQLTISLNAVQAASQASDREMVKVRATAIAMGKDFTIPGATAVDAADAIMDLVKSGVTLERAQVAARPALLLAAAAQVKIADAARVTGDVMDDFRLKADQAGHVASVLAAASNSAGGGLMDLFDGMKYAGPSARIVGINVDYTAAALVLMAKAGHQGSIGGTAFANMLTRLAPVSKSQKEAMHDLGVEAWDARGRFVGLPKVVDQLHQAMERMSPEDFQKTVQIAFGNRAKLAVFDFAHGGSAALDVFYKKLKAGDVQDYANKMNRGLSAAGKQLHKEVVSWAIDLNGELQPALASAAFALGDNLPGAISATGKVLRPLEQEFSAVFVPALHLTAEVLGLVGVGLGDVGSLLQHHTGTVQVLATVVVGMWAAWKGYTIATVAVRAIGSAIDTVRLKAMYARESVVGIANGTSSISAGALALGGIGIALGIAAYAWQKHSAAVADSKHEIDDFTASVKADSGALGDNSRQVAFNALQKMGAVDAARKLGIGIDTLTSAALGNAGAMGLINQRLADFPNSSALSAKAAGMSESAYLDLFNAADMVARGVGGTNSAVQKGVQGFKDQQIAVLGAAGASAEAATAQKALATSLTYTVDAAGNLVQAQQTVGGKVNDTTEELVKQKSASDLLKASLDALNGVNLSQEQTTNSFLDSMDALTESVKTNGRSLDQATSAGRKNREQMVSIIEAAKAQAQSTADTAARTTDQTSALKIGNEQLRKNEKQLRAQALRLGLSRAATDGLIASLGQLSTIKSVARVDADTKPAHAKLDPVRAKLDALTKQRTALLKLNDSAATPRLAAIQAQMRSLDGQVAHITVQIGVNNSVGRAVHDAVNSIPRSVTPGRAAGGSLPEGYSTIDEQGWELVHKQGSDVQVFSHQDSVKMLPEGPSVPAFASGTSKPKAAPKPKPVSATIVDTAGGGTVYGIATYIKGTIPSVRAAARLLSLAVDDAFEIKGVRAKIAAVKADLANVTQARSQFASGVVSSLNGQVDVTKYGDAAGMIAALQNGSASNAKFVGQERRLEAMHVPSALIQALTKDGPNAGLDTVASAGTSDLRQIIAQYSKFTSSAQAGGSLAGDVAFGPQIASDRKKIAADEARQAKLLRSMDKLVAQLGKQTKQPLEIKLNGEVIARVVIKSKAFAGELDEITHALTY